jgi:hypothetical protein
MAKVGCQCELQIAELHGATVNDRQSCRLQRRDDIVQVHMAVAVMEMVKQIRPPLRRGGKIYDQDTAARLHYSSHLPRIRITQARTT